MLNQTYFEMKSIPALAGRAWIPLRQDVEEKLDVGTGVQSASRYTGVATIAVFEDQTAAADELDWSDLDLGPHRSHPERDYYQPADVLLDRRTAAPIGLNLVIDQALEGSGLDVWHLHPDLVVALRLYREGDSWLRPKEGWLEAVRMIRHDDAPVLVEIRAELLADYLAARKMKLYASSYYERVVEADADPGFTWPAEDGFMSEAGRDRVEGRIAPLNLFGASRPGVRVAGALWRTEWFDPGSFSPRVRGDKDPNPIAFAAGPQGERLTPEALRRGIDWLYFQPSLVGHLLRYRDGRVHWYSQETGSVGAAEARVHFGVNAKGLITIFAKDIGDLQPWEQRIWASHSVPRDGGVSDELFQAQMECKPASTVAPEAELGTTIQSVDAAFAAAFGEPLLRSSLQEAELLARTHRFRAADPDGLMALAKDVTRLFVERVEVGAVHRAAAARGEVLPQGHKALKSLERLSATAVGEADARALMAPLFGVYDLRLADAHLSSSTAPDMTRMGVDLAKPAPMQGRALLASVVTNLKAMGATWSSPLKP